MGSGQREGVVGLVKSRSLNFREIPVCANASTKYASDFGIYFRRRDDTSLWIL